MLVSTHYYLITLSYQLSLIVSRCLLDQQHFIFDSESLIFGPLLRPRESMLQEFLEFLGTLPSIIPLPGATDKNNVNMISP